MNKPISKVLIFFLGGSLVLFVGGILGLLIGMTIGGNISPPFEYGGLPGYEGAGLLGSILGSSLAAYVWIQQRLQDPLKRNSSILLVLGMIITLLVQDHVARQNGVGVFFITFLPMILQGLLLIWYKPKDF